MTRAGMNEKEPPPLPRFRGIKVASFLCDRNKSGSEQSSKRHRSYQTILNHLFQYILPFTAVSMKVPTIAFFALAPVLAIAAVAPSSMYSQPHSPASRGRLGTSNSSNHQISSSATPSRHTTAWSSAKPRTSKQHQQKAHWRSEHARTQKVSATRMASPRATAIVSNLHVRFVVLDALSVAPASVETMGAERLC